MHGLWRVILPLWLLAFLIYDVRELDYMTPTCLLSSVIFTFYDFDKEYFFNICLMSEWAL